LFHLEKNYFFSSVFSCNLGFSSLTLVLSLFSVLASALGASALGASAAGLASDLGASVFGSSGDVSTVSSVTC